MKLLAVASSGDLGGAELALAEFLLRRPHEVEAVALLLGDGPLRSRLEQSGVSAWVAHGYRGRPSPVQLARFTRSMLRLIETTEPDVVWANGLKAAVMAVPACRLKGVPVVWLKVDFSLDATVTLPLSAAVDGVVAVSNAVAAALGPLRAHRLRGVIGPPIRLSDELHVVPIEHPPTIGTLATLIPYKGHRHIIEAAGLLSSEFPDLRVLLAGGRSSEYPDFPAELLAVVERAGMVGRVESAGFVDDVTEILERLTVFVNATFRDDQGFGLEGLSAAVLEASWAGLPVVVTTGGGSSEAVVDGVTGTLCDPADPVGLARAIAPYLRDPRVARAAGEAGRRFTREHFAPEILSSRLFETLSEIVEQSGRFERAVERA